jgi:hypothetical protein
LSITWNMKSTISGPESSRPEASLYKHIATVILFSLKSDRKYPSSLTSLFKSSAIVIYAS